MRIVFMGSPDFAVPSLQAIASQTSNEIVAVITGEDKRRGRGNELSPTAVKAAAIQLNLPVFSFESMKDERLATLLTDLKPDLIVIVAFKILPKHILAIPRLGSVNIHASLLPKYRGAAPIHWAVVNGDEKTGVSVFFLNELVDAGKILLQKETPIFPHENTGEVYSKLMLLGAEAIVESLQLIESNSFTAIEQNETLACPAPKVFPEQAHITFNKSAIEVHNWIRGMNPAPGSWVFLDGKKMKLKSARVSEYGLATKNELLLHENRVIIGCASGSIELLEVQLEGKAPVDALSFWIGYRGEKVLS